MYTRVDKWRVKGNLPPWKYIYLRAPHGGDGGWRTTTVKRLNFYLNVGIYYLNNRVGTSNHYDAIVRDKRFIFITTIAFPVFNPFAINWDFRLSQSLHQVNPIHLD